jgi:hypothetical protein
MTVYLLYIRRKRSRGFLTIKPSALFQMNGELTFTRILKYAHMEVTLVRRKEDKGKLIERSSIVATCRELMRIDHQLSKKADMRNL